MLRLVARRLLWSVPLVLAAAAVSFIAVGLLPGDAARSLLGQNATEEQLQQARHQLGLDLPLWEQYWHWLTNALQGDLGTSLISRTPVVDELNSRIGASLSLIIGATLLAAVVGIALGVRGARRGRIGRLVDTVSVIGLAVPDFWLGLILVVVFAVELQLFPPNGYVDPLEDPIGWASSLVLPVITLAVPAVAIIAKQTRDAVATALDRPFVRTLRAAGISDRSILFRHALRNAAIPILTVVGLVFVGALSGTVAVEFIFAIPGLGSTAVQATAAHDFPLIQGVVVYFTLIVIVVNLAVDLAYGYFNPRVRLT
ncbi:ABC transporter permease [Terrabacter sp. Ter38]|uniref:ABC transporter permease n=1 Tax=Terrabacter sp. Ter38 TaxID=2926030 RepID=UPI0021180369|nr:ABC transporter permease [Terrabacter sp. Ter38]